MIPFHDGIMKVFFYVIPLLTSPDEKGGTGAVEMPECKEKDSALS